MAAVAVRPPLAAAYCLSLVALAAMAPVAAVSPVKHLPPGPCRKLAAVVMPRQILQLINPLVMAAIPSLAVADVAERNLEQAIQLVTRQRAMAQLAVAQSL
jgi:hypothetical protein